jgi:hypothetical protein
MAGAAPESAHSGLLGNPMNMMVPAHVPPGCAREDLMTRRQVASLFRVTSAGGGIVGAARALPEFATSSKPRYRRSDVETLFRSGTRRTER